ncbi:MAG: DUF1501 domain-containing protein [Planctomycetota bacterium]|nr:DUF1501 domain-containing protein [Planctomycetota bacterium]MDA1214581.1 DUF1501 domain-containing protein [Planctomycetota bacterium]
MNAQFDPGLLLRRRFLQQSACGLGMMALGDIMSQDGLTAESSEPTSNTHPMAPKFPHFTGTAKRVIFICMAGGPSHLDLFDPKPIMQEMNGKPVPPSFLEGLPDKLIQGSATVFASPRKFTKYGECGMEFSDFVPNLGTCADDICMVRSMWTTSPNHDPGQLLLQCGSPQFGHPAMGSWVTYGLGSESQNLPGFVVLLSNSGKGVDAGSALWNNGYLPSYYRGVTFRSEGDPILHLSNPDGITPVTQRSRLDAIRDLNQLRHEQTGDPEILSRIAAYELAYRMQTAAPELLDFSDETYATQELYGLNYKKTNWFGTNCLLARRMIERGVRFVQLYHSTWDDHGNLEHYLGINTGMTDLPAAGLIHDLKQRGLLEDTLIVWGGEFGRTPMNEVRRGVNPKALGRDHHPYGFTMLLAGGGIKGGQVVGKTDEIGYHAVEDRIHPHELQATMLHCLGFDHMKLTYKHQGLEARLTGVEEPHVVQKLLA